MSKKNRVSSNTSKHHRMPRSRGGLTNDRNCVMLNPDVHVLWHKLFSNLTPIEIQVEICRVFYGFDESQMTDIRMDAFLDLVIQVTEGKDRC